MKKRLIFVFETILTIIIVGLCVLIVAISKGFHPSIGGYEVLRVITGSMEPELEENSIIIIKHTDVSELKKGDIITFKSEDPQVKGLYVTHRIYDIQESQNGIYFVTKGDANETEDMYVVHEKNIAGKYVKKLPMGLALGKFINKISTSRMYFLVVLLPVLVVFLIYIWQMVKIIFVDSEDDEKTTEESKDSTEN